LVLYIDVAVLNSVHTFAFPGHPVTAQAFCANSFEVAVAASGVKVRAYSCAASSLGNFSYLACNIFPVVADLAFVAFPVFVLVVESIVWVVNDSFD